MGHLVLGQKEAIPDLFLGSQLEEEGILHVGLSLGPVLGPPGGRV